jgi:hypothetical protein
MPSRQSVVVARVALALLAMTLATTGTLKLIGAGQEHAVLFGSAEIAVVLLLLWTRTRRTVAALGAVFFLGAGAGTAYLGPAAGPCCCLGDIQLGWGLEVTAQGVIALLCNTVVLLSRKDRLPFIENVSTTAPTKADRKGPPTRTNSTSQT